MTITELIESLKEFHTEFGDIEVVIPVTENEGDDEESEWYSEINEVELTDDCLAVQLY